MHLPGHHNHHTTTRRESHSGGEVYTVCTQCKRVFVPSPNNRNSSRSLRVSADDDDQWMNVEDISNTQAAQLVNLSHGLCASCFRRVDASLVDSTPLPKSPSYPRRVIKSNSAPAILSKPTSSQRILVVDDNKLQRLIHKRIVEQAGYQCDAVESGEQAIEMVKTTPYSLILMDLMMTGADGWETSKKIRQMVKDSVGFGGIPKVIAVTGMQIDNQLIKDCAAAGMDDIVHKPVAPAVLHKLLARYNNQ